MVPACLDPALLRSLAARVMWRWRKDQGLASDSQLVAADQLKDHLEDLPEEEQNKVQSDVDNLLKFWTDGTKLHSVGYIRHILGLVGVTFMFL